MTQRKRRIPKNWQTASDNIRYASIDKLEEKIPQGVSFTLVHIMDELMGVSKEKIHINSCVQTPERNSNL